MNAASMAQGAFFGLFSLPVKKILPVKTCDVRRNGEKSRLRLTGKEQRSHDPSEPPF